MFTIYKEGTTTNRPVKIMRKDGEDFDIEAKIAKYENLGYAVTRL